MSITYVSTLDIIQKTDERINATTDYLSVLDKLSSFKTISLDIETYVPLESKGHIATDALNPHTSNISLVAIKPSVNQTTIIFDWLALENEPEFKTRFTQFLETRDHIVVHNASFEAKFFKKHLGVLLFNYWCTRVASQLIGNGLGGRFYQQIGGYSYKSLCFNFLDVNLEGKGSEQIDDWYTRPVSFEKLQYVYYDVEYLFPLKELFEGVLLKPTPNFKYYKKPYPDWGFDCAELLDLEMQYISCSAETEYNGLPFNETINSELQNNIYNKSTNSGYIVELATELADYFGYKKEIDLITGKEIVGKEIISALRSSVNLVVKLNEKFGDNTFKNAESAAIVRLIELYELLSKGETDPYYCDDERELYAGIVSAENQSNFTILKTLSLFKKFTKQADMNLLKYRNSVTRRIHPSFNSLGARTGRTTCSNPNIQNVNSRTSLEIKIKKENVINYFNNLLKQSKSIPGHEL